MTSRAAPNEAPVVSLEKVMPRFVVIRLRRAGGGRRPSHIWGAQVSLVNGAAEPTAGEAERGNKETFTRCHATVPTTGSPPSVRLYARWMTQRGKFSPWSLPLPFRPQI